MITSATATLPANPERDDIHLLRSFNDDNMNYNFSTLSYNAEFQIRRRLRRRRSTSDAHTVNSTGSTTGTQPRQQRASTAAPGSPRRTNRRPRNNNQSDSALTYTAEDAINDISNHTTQGDSSSGVGLSEFLQLSMAFTASLADQVSDDESVYLVDENVTVHTTSAPANTTSRNTARNGAQQHQRRRTRPGRRGSMAGGSVSANSSSTNGERRAPPKKNPRRPSNINRRERPKKAENGGAKKDVASKSKPNLADLAEQARASIECPICLFHYDENAGREPCTLRCGHSMCLSHAKDLRKCPICRATFNVQALKKSVVLCEAANAINSMVSAILE